MASRSGKKQKKNLAGCAGGGRQSKGTGEEKMTIDSAIYKCCNEFMRRMCERGGVAWEGREVRKGNVKEGKGGKEREGT